MIDEPNCANAPCKTCQWKDTCDRYLEYLEYKEMEAWVEYEKIGEELD